MIDDPLSLLSLGIWLMAAGMYPLGFLFGACSACCDQECPWIIEYDRCLRVSIVGSNPPVGGDCRILSSGAESNDAPFMDSGLIQIHYVQSEIRAAIRLSLSASGASRTPVGETRTQVWRFNRAAPSSPASTTYDVLGPGWHLQVDLSVTGVATEQEAAVVSSIGTDSEGQPKLVLQVNQWTQTITYDETVTLFPTGLQRWGPGISGTQSFRLTTSVVSATRLSGDNISGWSVSKLSGLTIDERKFAVRLNGTLCGSGANGTVTQRIILNDEVAVDFLNGDQDLVTYVPSAFNATAGDRSLRILPNNILCELSSDDTGVGVAAGIYPAVVYATPSQHFIDSAEVYCDRTPYVMRYAPGVISSPFTSTTAGLWKSSYNYRGVGRFDFGWIEVRANNFFYSGKSLLWNAEHGPYRTTGPGSGPATPVPPSVSNLESAFNPFPGWICHIEGDGNELFNKPEAGACPDGMAVPSSPLFNLWNVCTPLSVNVEGTYAIGYRPGPYLGGPLPDIVTITGTMQGTLQRNTDLTKNSSGLALFLPVDQQQPLLYFTGTLTGEEHEFIEFASGNAVSVTPTFTGGLGFVVPCDSEGETTPFAIDPPAIGLGGFGPFYLSFANLPNQIFVVFGQNGNEFSASLPFASRSRPSCSEWTTAPAEGGTITRTCENLDGFLAEQYISTVPINQVPPDAAAFQSIVVPPRNSRVSTTYTYEAGSPVLGGGRGFYGPGPTQLGACKLIGLSSIQFGFTRNLVPATQLVSSALSSFGSCFNLLPVFGTSFPGAQTTNLSASTTVPCGDCTPTVAITDGAENASVQYVLAGDKAGVVEVFVKRTWLGGQGVTFTVTCGSETVTHTLRRVNTVPLAPRNLAVINRDPCSQATLQWQAPDWNGGQPITAYNIEFRRIGVNNYTSFGTVAPPALSATVTGLVRLGYEFRVSATNSVGTSEFSNVATNGFALTAPTGLTAAPRNPCDAVSLSWTPPTQSTCVVVDQYQVQFRVTNVGSYQTVATVPGTETTATVTGLTPTTGYQFVIRLVGDANTVLFSNVIAVAGCPPE